MDIKLNKDSKAIIELMISDGIITQEIAEKYFPELKESEEDRMRKEIVNWFTEFPDTMWRGFNKNKVLAWLEKLGEKSEKVIDEDKVERAYQNGYDDGMRAALGEQAVFVNDPFIQFTTVEDDENNPKWTELTWEDIVYLEELMANVHYEFRNGIGQESFGKEVLEKFREHKGDEYLDSIESKDNHSDWTEGDEEIKNIFVDSINLLSWNNICLDNKSKRDCISWIDNIKNRIQPKQEWGEEDERMQALVNNLLWEGYKASEGENIPTWKEIVHWFKSLNISN